ncbi:MAG: type II toxin-antitoxin system HicA family toxin [Candidatus Liptonbacteria bacterium]|nr:type II toxin-antitoxin system HicA family toxin [Candidatus Liptonbacteria bacterium]
MKRRDLLRYLTSEGCAVLREGAKHTVVVHIPSIRTSTIPRHSEINDFLAKKICRDLGIRQPRR